MDPLKLYLANQSQAGQHQSEGSFTVAGEKALDKLSSHQLPRTSAWILKMVQAGVQARSEAMWVTHERSSCKIRYLNGELGSLEDLRDQWYSPTPSLTAAQKDLFVGLRTVAFARRRPVLMVHHCSLRGLRTLLWNGSSLGSLNCEEEKSRLFALKAAPGEMVFHVANSPLGPDHTLEAQKGIKDTVTAEYKELQNFGISCPVPLWADSRSLNHFGLQDLSMTRKVLTFSAQGPVRPDQPTLALPNSLQQQTNLSQGAGLAWTLSLSEKIEQSKVSWVKGGIVCQEQPLAIQPNRYALRLFLSVEDLETDLTSLYVRFPRGEAARRAAEGVLGFCQELRAGSLVYQQIARAQKDHRGAFATVAGLWFCGLLFVPATSGLSLLAGAGASALVVAHKRRHSAESLPDLEIFCDQLRRRYAG